jgi:hypothetical protein
MGFSRVATPVAALGLDGLPCRSAEPSSTAKEHDDLISKTSQLCLAEVGGQAENLIKRSISIQTECPDFASMLS